MLSRGRNWSGNLADTLHSNDVGTWGNLFGTEAGFILPGQQPSRDTSGPLANTFNESMNLQKNLVNTQGLKNASSVPISTPTSLSAQGLQGAATSTLQNATSQNGMFSPLGVAGLAANVGGGVANTLQSGGGALLNAISGFPTPFGGGNSPHVDPTTLLTDAERQSQLNKKLEAGPKGRFAKLSSLMQGLK